MVNRKIIWDKPAVIYFSEAIRYIRKDSPQNADKVKKEIREKIAEAALRPEINPPINITVISNSISGLLNYTV
jgi:plasmid stabilization system protein ParE